MVWIGVFRLRCAARQQTGRLKRVLGAIAADHHDIEWIATRDDDVGLP